jgi:hypothetical protein
VEQVLHWGRINYSNNQSSNSNSASKERGSAQELNGKAGTNDLHGSPAKVAVQNEQPLRSPVLSKTTAAHEKVLTKAGLSLTRLSLDHFEATCTQGVLTGRQARASGPGFYLNPPEDHGLQASESGFYINPG